MELGGILEVLKPVNLAFKECLGLCRRREVSLSRSKGPWTRPGPAVKAFGKAQPSSPGEAGPSSGPAGSLLSALSFLGGQEVPAPRKGWKVPFSLPSQVFSEICSTPPREFGGRGCRLSL